MTPPRSEQSSSAAATRWHAAMQSARGPLLLGLAYYFAALLGFQLTYQQSPTSSFWAPNAILMAAFLLTPTRRWPWLLLGALPAHLLVELIAGYPLTMVLSWFVSNSTEALIGAACVRHYVERPFRLDRFAHVSVFVVFGVAFAAFASSLLDAAFVTLNDVGELGYWALWRNRFFANTLANITVVPFIVAWGSVNLMQLRRAPVRRYLEAAVLGASILLMSVFVFSMQQAGGNVTGAMLYAPLPLLLWAAIRFGPTGQSTSVLGVVLFSIWSTSQGRGPFNAPAEQNALAIQLLFATVSIALMTLSAVLEERKQAQAATIQKSEQLQLAMDAAHMSPWDWRIPSRAALVEAARPMLYPANAEAVIATSDPAERIHPGDVLAVTSAIARSTEEGTPLKIEFRVLRADGRVRWLLGQGKVLFDEARQPTRMIGLTADITERKTAEALSAGENRILELIATGAALTDILHSLVSFIESETTGMMCSIVLLDGDGVHIRYGAAPSLPESYVRATEGAAIGPRAGSCGTAMFRKQRVVVTDILDDPLWTDYRDLAAAHHLRACWSQPIISEQGRVLGSFAMYYDQPRGPAIEEIRMIDVATQLAAIAIERKRAEAEVHEQRRALAHLARVAMLGELSGALAHELKQPLTAVLSNAQAAQRLLARDPPDLAEVQAILSDIVAADRRASDVIDRLRPMLIKGQVQLTPVELGDIVVATLKLARGDLAAREVSVATRIDEELPCVLGDRVQLQQVLLNLIVNACDAMSAIAAPQRQLLIAARRTGDGNAVEISIADSGSGIPEHMIHRIFDPFFSSKEHGLGMGLPICRSIAVAHRGRVYAMNNVGGGATFILTLPIARQEVA